MRNQTQEYEVRKHEEHQIWSFLFWLAYFQVVNYSEDEAGEKDVQSCWEFYEEILEHGVGAEALRQAIQNIDFYKIIRDKCKFAIEITIESYTCTENRQKNHEETLDIIPSTLLEIDLVGLE